MIFRPGKPSDAIVTDREFAGDPDGTGDHLEYYGGYLVAESVAPRFKPLLMAAPDLLAACEAAIDLLPCGAGATIQQVRSAIAKAQTPNPQ